MYSQTNLIHNFLYQFLCNLNLPLITSNLDSPFFGIIPFWKMLRYQLKHEKKTSSKYTSQIQNRRMKGENLQESHQSTPSSAKRFCNVLIKNKGKRLLK